MPREKEKAGSGGSAPGLGVLQGGADEDYASPRSSRLRSRSARDVLVGGIRPLPLSADNTGPLEAFLTRFNA